VFCRVGWILQCAPMVNAAHCAGAFDHLPAKRTGRIGGRRRNPPPVEKEKE